jgi:hypothetical protein
VGPKPLNGWFISDFWSNHSTFMSSIVNYILIFQWHLDFITLYYFLTIVDISILCFLGVVPYMRFQDSSRYGEIQR